VGQISQKNIVIIIILLTLTGIMIHRPVGITGNHKKKASLDLALSQIHGWEKSSFIELQNNIVSALELDDYVNTSYYSNTGKVHLYIGYYHTGKKIGAAHDPLVCYPGQGWKINQKANGNYQVSSKNNVKINYSAMIAELGQSKDYIVYWFQSVDETSAGTFMQKVRLIGKKLLGSGDENAFVRISTSIERNSLKKSEKVVFEFIEAFYPVFLDYIKSNAL